MLSRAHAHDGPHKTNSRKDALGPTLRTDVSFCQYEAKMPHISTNVGPNMYASVCCTLTCAAPKRMFNAKIASLTTSSVKECIVTMNNNTSSDGGRKPSTKNVAGQHESRCQHQEMLSNHILVERTYKGAFLIASL